MIRTYLTIAWAVVRLIGRVVGKLLLVPVICIGLMIAIPVLTARMLYYIVSIVLCLRHPAARACLRTMGTGEELSTGGRDDGMETGFNVDLDRDFVGATQVRREESLAGRVL